MCMCDQKSSKLKRAETAASHSPKVFVWKPQLNANLKICLFDALCNLQQKGEFLYAVVTIILESQGSKLPLANHLCKVGECIESIYTVTALDFGSRYCPSRGSSTNTRPNLKTDT